MIQHILSKISQKNKATYFCDDIIVDENTGSKHYLKYKHQFLFLLLFFATITSCNSQTKFNPELKQELDSILKVDQTFRKIYRNPFTEEARTFLKSQGYTSDEFKNQTWPIINKHDKLNLSRIEEIITTYGYPGKKLVDTPTSNVAWYVIQHSDKIENYFPIIQKAGKNGDIPLRKVAMMEDRLLMQKGLPQKYGTQATSRELINSNGQKEWFEFIWPIENPELVNDRRKLVGFTETIEVYCQHLLKKPYKIYTLKQIKELNF